MGWNFLGASKAFWKKYSPNMYSSQAVGLVHKPKTSLGYLKRSGYWNLSNVHWHRSQRPSCPVLPSLYFVLPQPRAGQLGLEGQFEPGSITGLCRFLCASAPSGALVQLPAQQKCRASVSAGVDAPLPTRPAPAAPFANVTAHCHSKHCAGHWRPSDCVQITLISTWSQLSGCCDLISKHRRHSGVFIIFVCVLDMEICFVCFVEQLDASSHYPR